MATPPSNSRTSAPDRSERSKAASRSRRGPPRASRRSVFEIFHRALAEIDRLSDGSSYNDLPTFTQDWLKGRVSDYGNALSLMRTWGLLTKPGNLSPEFVDRVREAHESQRYDNLRVFLRDQFRVGYENLIANRAHDYDPALLEHLGEEDFDTSILQDLPGIADEEEFPTRDKREQCITAVSDVIRYCHDRAVLGKEAAQKASGSAQTSPPRSRLPSSEATLPAFDLKDSHAAVIHHRTFNMRDESHKNVDAEVWLNVPLTPYWIEQLGLRLLDWADQLREQQRD